MTQGLGPMPDAGSLPQPGGVGPGQSNQVPGMGPAPGEEGFKGQMPIGEFLF